MAIMDGFVLVPIHLKISLDATSVVRTVYRERCAVSVCGVGGGRVC